MQKCIGSIPGRYSGKSQRDKKSNRKGWSKLFVLQSLYRFQGSKPGSTLKTAQPDGKHLVEKPVAILQIGLRITIKL